MSPKDTIQMEPLLPMPYAEQAGSSNYSKRRPGYMQAAKSNLEEMWQSVNTKRTSPRVWTLVSVSFMILAFGGLSISMSKTGSQSNQKNRMYYTYQDTASQMQMSDLPVCERTFLYTFFDYAGFGSTLSHWGEAAMVAAALNYTMIIDDSKWQYGRLTDYFDLAPLNCQPPKNVSRDVFKNSGNDTDHVWSNRDVRGAFTGWIHRHIDSRAIDTHAVWNLQNFREQRTVLPAEQNVHFTMKAIFDAKTEAYRSIWRPNKMVLEEIRKMKREINDKLLGSQKRNAKSPSDFDLHSPMARKLISLHFRLGDKKVENADWHPALAIGMQSAVGNPKPYLDVVRSFVPKWRTSNDLPSLFVMSDDPETASALLDEHQSFYQPTQRFPILFPPHHHPLASHGHEQGKFNSAPPEVRKKLTTALIRDITFAVEESEAIACSSSSNICNIIFHLRGSDDAIGPHGHVRSVDVRWFPNAMIHDLNNLSLDYKKNRTEILDMAPKLAADPRNYIDN
ncbi:hypothetical protein DFH28DRAFT_1016631 [Melampsora americana]|nr:hypothetical protein DFH28DRAFT_1016631 [Melampsora americana]